MVATSSVGTPFQIHGKNKILFFEEMSERGYRIDRCLQQMKQAGVFKDVRAILLGDFFKCEEPSGTDLSINTIKAFFEEVKIPVFQGVQSGHATIQRPLFLGTKATLTKSVIAPDRFQVLVYSPYEILKPRK